MNNIDNTPNCIGGKKHYLTPVRFRGSKRRLQCTVCHLMTGWRKPTEVKPKVKEQIGEDEVTFADQRESYEHWTVDDLKRECRDRGITGYSKMKKDDLMDVLARDDQPVPV